MAADPPPDLISVLSHRYHVERELGQGGMATVYLARDPKHDRKVAIKVLRPELAAIVGAERFLAEIRTTAQLQHPHILPLHDSGEAEGFLFYVMPYVEGESLRDRLRRETQLGVDEAVAITTKVADALDYAHERGVVHRDIKPANILLSDRGEPLLADFGIALAVAQAGGGRITETGLSLGTPHYMSPEQATGEREVDPRSDVYALGCVLYEMLAGEPPFAAPTAQAVLVRVLTTHATRITALRTTVPLHVDAALARALEKLPADRFPSATDFARALADPRFRYRSFVEATIGDDVGTEAPAAAPGAKRSASLAAWSLSAVLALLAGWGWLRTTPDAPVSRYSIRLPEDQRLSGLNGSHLAIAPDGASFVFSASADGRDRLWLRHRDQLEAVPLPGSEAARDPAYSVDGQRISFAVAGSGIQTVAVTGGPAVPFAATGGGAELLSEGGHSWGEDGSVVAATRTGLVRYLGPGEAPESLSTIQTERGETRHIFPHALPDGRHVLFTITYRAGGLNRMIDADIALLDLESGEYDVLFPGVRALYSSSGHVLYLTLDGTLYATPFDPRGSELPRPGTALVTGIAVSAGGFADIALSASGTLMYTSGVTQASTELVWVDRDGRQTSIDVAWGGAFGSLALSPDGTRIAVGAAGLGYGLGGTGQEGGGIRVLRLGDGVVQRLTVDGFQNQRPVWTSDGEALIYSSDREQDGDLWRIPADGGGDPELLLRRERRVADGFLSPDGAWLIYRTSAAVAGAGDILAVPMGPDSVPVPLLDSPSGERAPILSPSGEYLAYVSDETGRDEVFVKRFLDSGDAKWIISREGGIEPTWSADGTELFYRNDAGQLVSVEVRSEGSFVAGPQTVLFDASGFAVDSNYRSYAVTRDGRRFAFIRTERTSEPEIIVVENFLQDLEALLQADR